MKPVFYFLTVLTVFVFTACSESFLDTSPTDSYTEDNFWTSEDNVVSAVNGCYQVLFRHAGYKLYLDNITPNSYNQSGQTQLATGTHDAGNVDWFHQVWNLNYEGIGRANNVLAHIDAVTLNESLRDRLRGEALFLRALFYEELVRLYGDVPLILAAPDRSEQAKLPRDPKSAVVTQILADLNQAAQLLPPSYTGGNIGRATQGAALALKARVLLYENRWEEAAAAAEAVFPLGYRLFSNYRQLFMEANENNPEVIFDIQFSAPNYVHSLNLNLDLQMNIAPLPDLVNSYLMSDGEPASSSSSYNPQQPYENRDPRLHQTIVIPGYIFKGITANEKRYYATGFGFKKYTTYEDHTSYPSDVINSPLNIILLRYADVLLMYAEARNEAGGPDNSIYDALDEIRQRAGMPDVPRELSKEDLREVIRLERRIELAGEGLYYNDIRRWRTAETVNNGPIYNSAGVAIQNRSFNKDRDYLWPVATISIEQNPNLEQTPGYTK
ncbi:RagB/SusD family nutrient uptake outer membrane protein [Parapedobacter pyrenivorans]|uniref:RagB/SusD family nutrient uptake outer membrane protein n=1 Tax=Parapedobacter pyrenivorans TaxID=1305674 RepID=UPI00334112E1